MKEKREEKERKKIEKEKTKKKKERKKRNSGKKKEECGIEGNLDLSDEDAICPKCGISSTDVDDLWISCDTCGKWFDFKCKSRKRIPEFFLL